MVGSHCVGVEQDKGPAVRGVFHAPRAGSHLLWLGVRSPNTSGEVGSWRDGQHEEETPSSGSTQTLHAMLEAGADDDQPGTVVYLIPRRPSAEGIGIPPLTRKVAFSARSCRLVPHLQANRLVMS